MTVSVLPDPNEDDEVCGETYDHDTRTTYDGPDGIQWECLRCGAEGWEEPDE